MTGFKGEKVQNPSDDHTIEEARVARIAKSQQRTCPRRTRASRGTVAARQTTFVRKPPLSVMLDSAEHHLTSMAAAKRLNPIVTWPPSAKGHHDAMMVQVKTSSLTSGGRQNDRGWPTFVRAAHFNLHLFGNALTSGPTLLAHLSLILWTS